MVFDRYDDISAKDHERIRRAGEGLVQQPSRHFSLNLAKIPPNQVIADFGRGSSVESESE